MTAVERWAALAVRIRAGELKVPDRAFEIVEETRDLIQNHYAEAPRAFGNERTFVCVKLHPLLARFTPGGGMMWAKENEATWATELRKACEEYAKT